VKTYNLLYKLIRCSLGEDIKIDVAGTQTEKIMNLSIRQGVSLIAFDGFQKAYNNERNANSEFVKLQWIGQSIQSENTNKLILAVQQQISNQLKQNGIKALVLKGSALANYYDTPDFRQYGDIDIYSPTEFEKIDDILKSIGTNYDLECYRHSHCQVKGITVENHIYLTDARWKKKWAGLEDYLSKLASKNLLEQEEYGLGYPDEMFTIVFFVYHALAHFVYEQLSVRFLVDWYYLLKSKNDLDYALLETKLNEFGLMPLTGALTALCIKRLGMDENLVPKYMIDAARNITPSLLKKFEDDMFDESHSGFTTNSLKDRIARLSKFYQYRWKIEEFYGISLLRFIWSKVVAIIKWN
jgi:hypothetical protein